MGAFFLLLLFLCISVISTTQVVEGIEKKRLNIQHQLRNTLHKNRGNFEPGTRGTALKRHEVICRDSLSYRFDFNGVNCKCSDIKNRDKSQNDSMCNILEVKENCSKSCGNCFEVSVKR